MREDGTVRLTCDHRSLDVADSEYLTARLSCLAHRRDGVGGLTRLRDDDDQVILIQHRVSITKLRGVIDLNGDSRKLFEHVLAGEAGVPRRSARGDLDRGDGLEVVLGTVHLLEVHFAVIKRNT